MSFDRVVETYCRPRIHAYFECEQRLPQRQRQLERACVVVKSGRRTRRTRCCNALRRDPANSSASRSSPHESPMHWPRQTQRCASQHKNSKNFVCPPCHIVVPASKSKCAFLAIAIRQRETKMNGKTSTLLVPGYLNQ